MEIRNTVSKNESKEKIIGTWVASGTALGAAFGAAFGDVAIGVALGVAIGAAIGAAKCKRPKDNGESLSGFKRLLRTSRI